MAESIETTPDQQHLRTLSICFYVLGSLSALSGCVLMGFAMVGVAVIAGAVNAGPAAEFVAFLGLFLMVLELALALFVWTMCFFEFFTGRSLATHTRYRLCLIIACIELLNIPLGTALAIFTLIVLQRPSVRDLFAGGPDRKRRLEVFDDAENVPPASAPKGPDDGSMREGVPK
jgi:hypothetical protein